jgi:hypothetical protein
MYETEGEMDNQHGWLANEKNFLIPHLLIHVFFHFFLLWRRITSFCEPGWPSCDKLMQFDMTPIVPEYPYAIYNTATMNVKL